MPRRPSRAPLDHYYVIRDLNCQPVGENLNFITHFEDLTEARAFAVRYAAIHGSSMEICQRVQRGRSRANTAFERLERIEAPWRITQADLVPLRVAHSIVHSVGVRHHDQEVREKAEALVAAFRAFAALVKVSPTSEPEPDSPQTDTIPGALRQE